ncbi:SPASM domain-containing protein [Methanosarcina horonobensis]|uniref:SPASM domain-containing protein n=1 Tax=Methanosarcina horonobensis TaxID=418008 RepID=UPI0022B925C1|nr:SPASM domain-containing protein [Methanosarcina horonobensis]
MPEYVMGNVYDRPTMADLAQSDAWKLMHKFKEFVNTACGNCAHIKYCRGGCPYNAIVPTNGGKKCRPALCCL